MKKQILIGLTTLSLFVTLAATSVQAQSDMHLKVNIPFEFFVKNRLLPAGEYTVRQIAGDALQIRSVDCRASDVFITIPAQAGTTPTQPTLIFHRYGDQYFLSTIWRGTDDTGRQLLKSHAERELIRARSALAKSASERQTVLVPAHR